MNPWFLIPAILGLAVTLAVWTALRLIFWARTTQNIAGALTLIGMALIMMGFLYQLVIPDERLAHFLMQIQGLGYNLLYPGWVVFVLILSGNEKRVTRGLVGALILLSVIPLIFLFHPDTSAWFIQTTYSVSAGPFQLQRQQIGWFAILNGVIGQTEGAISALLLFQTIFRVRPAYRMPVISLFLSMIVIFIAGLIEYLQLNPVAPLSPVALVMIPISMRLNWIMFSLRVGQVLPIIRERVVENMRDSVVVINPKMHVAYLNPSAARMFQQANPLHNRKPLELVKLPADTPLRALSPELADILETYPYSTSEQEEDHKSISLGGMVYSISRSILEDWKGEIVGQFLVLRNITDHEKMEKALQMRASELARSSAFTEALSFVAARVSASADLDQVYQTLNQELDRINIHFLVAIKKPDHAGFAVQYISLMPALIKRLEELVGMTISDFNLPEFEILAEKDAFVDDGSIYYSEILKPAKKLFKHFPEPVFQLLLKAADIQPRTSSFVFRLAHNDVEMGVFCVWGEALREQDFSALSVFAAQVSAAIQKVRLIESEQNRVVELERANGFLTTLSQVASRFEADLNMEQITETISAELRSLGADFVIAITDPATDELVGRYTSVTPSIWNACEKITGLTLSDFRIPYTEWRSLTPQSDGPAFIIEDPVDFAYQVMRGLPKAILRQTIPMVGITPDKPAVWAPMTVRGRIIGILIIWGVPHLQNYLPAVTLFARQAASVMEKARLISELETMKSFNEGIVQGVAETIIIVGANGQVSFANPAAARLWGREAKQIVGMNWQALIPACEREKFQCLLTEMNGKTEGGIELSVLHQSGSITPVLVNIQPRFVEEQLESVLISMVDIEQRVRAERQIRASIQEKEAMLKEIHHRVKNNLQIISSLLNLQSDQIKDKKTIEFFRESQTRIRSMALIHEKLYRSDNLASIQFDEYIRELGSFLLRTYSQNTQNIQLEVQADPVNLDLDTAIPCSLIINELVSNSLKYGFSADHDRVMNGRITIRLAKLGEDRIQLVVEDNGVGFPLDVDLRKSKSLGLQLVNSLTRQLAGEVCFTNQSGARVEIDFTVDEKEKEAK